MIVWNFELYMLPISLLVLFMKNMFASSLAYNYGKEPETMVSLFKETLQYPFQIFLNNCLTLLTTFANSSVSLDLDPNHLTV